MRRTPNFTHNKPRLSTQLGFTLPSSTFRALNAIKASAIARDSQASVGYIHGRPIAPIKGR